MGANSLWLPRLYRGQFSQKSGGFLANVSSWDCHLCGEMMQNGAYLGVCVCHVHIMYILCVYHVCVYDLYIIYCIYLDPFSFQINSKVLTCIKARPSHVGVMVFQLLRLRHPGVWHEGQEPGQHQRDALGRQGSEASEASEVAPAGCAFQTGQVSDFRGKIEKNMTGSGLEHDFYFPFSWECHHPNWRTHIFQRVRVQPPTRWYQQPLFTINHYEPLTATNHY